MVVNSNGNCITCRLSLRITGSTDLIKNKSENIWQSHIKFLSLHSKPKQKEMGKLELEFRDQFKGTTSNFKMGKMLVMVTPPLGEDYWVFRIKLHKDQAIVAFPKFGTIGIGFAIEDDWNTNLPWDCETEEIYNHIKCNKKYKEITKKTCIEAINILKKASEYYKNNEMTEEKYSDEQTFSIYMEKLEKFIQK
jgi:hypothetical protein